ncbi:MAG TPA: fumarate hydratase [Anaerolineae bacterium]|nr:fumarate hydratase [Anaerolineae bacterium]
MREIHVNALQSAIRELIEESAYSLPDDYLAAMAEAQKRERSAVGQSIILMLRDNAAYASAERIPTCQDTGMAILWLEVGQDVHFTGGDINAALETAVREAYKPLRKSIVADPLQRNNTGDNTPPIVHYQLIPGNQVRITVMIKGFGAEMMSRLRMFPPSAGLRGVKRFVLETVEKAGPNACPPVIVGVGLGSSFDGVAMLAKKALLRPLDRPNPLPHLSQLEAEWLAAINALGIGPQGFGGAVTALAVHVESYPTHIAALPVAVNLNCSAPRRMTITL